MDEKSRSGSRIIVLRDYNQFCGLKDLNSLMRKKADPGILLILDEKNSNPG
jgi:hypothetical protein